MTQPKCENCRWWERDGDEREGQCHRRAPSIVAGMIEPDDEDLCVRVWPWTFQHDYCGEHTPKSTDQNKEQD